MLYEQLTKILQERIMILDGSMGAYLQQFKLTEEDFRGERFKDHTSPLRGNNDILCITKPEIIKEVHSAYLEAGADIIETNTFNGTSISQEDYNTQGLVYEINFEAAKIAKETGVKKLILTHFDSNSFQTLKERKEAERTARTIFKNTTAAFDNLKINL